MEDAQVNRFQTFKNKYRGNEQRILRESRDNIYNERKDFD